MASSGDVQVVPGVEQPVAVVEVVPGHGADMQQLVAVDAGDGGSGLPATKTTKEEIVLTSTALQEQQRDTSREEPDHHHEDEAAASEQQAAEVSASHNKPGEEEKPPVAKEEGEHNSKAHDVEDDHHQDSTRERLKRHRQEVAGRVWVPEKWGQEKLLKDWVDCAVFDRPLVPAGLLTARRALVAESCTRRRSDRTSTTTTVSSAGSSPLRVRNGCS